VEGKNYLSALHTWKERKGRKGTEGREGTEGDLTF
tara:strand:+ start:931 stop:1035 length:105 start_codon:yes stop_codon:yes gene_type:complete